MNSLFDQSMDDDFLSRTTLAKGEAGHAMTLLPEDFEPGEHDVICGRGRKIFMHIGNERFRRMVADCLDEYSASVTKLEKSYILCDIVAQVRSNSPNGGFVKKDPKDGRWCEVGDFLAREKTSQAFRDALHDQYKSSNTAKKIRRQSEQKTIPRRAFSTSLLEQSKSQQKKESASYSDPLLNKLRARKSARSVFEFGEEGSSREPSAPRMAQQSCPNFARTAASAPVLNSGTSNFVWDSDPVEDKLSSLRNFEWTTPESPSVAPKRSSLDFFTNFTLNKQNKLSKVTETEMEQSENLLTASIDDFDMLDDMLLSAPIESPQKIPMSVDPMSVPDFSMEAQLRELRRSTFEEELPMMKPTLEAIGEERKMDVFERLVDLVGDVETMGDPFEPNPLP